MKSRHRIWGVVSGVMTIAVLLVLLLFQFGGRVEFASAVTVEQSGRFGNSIYSRSFHVFWFTNTSDRELLLVADKSQWRSGERVVNDMNARWNGQDREVILPAGSVAGLGVDLQDEFDASRVWFDYSWDGGSGLSGVSQVFRRLPRRLLPDGLHRWMRRYGLYDGRRHQQFLSAWEPNQTLERKRYAVGSEHESSYRETNSEVGQPPTALRSP